MVVLSDHECGIQLLDDHQHHARVSNRATPNKANEDKGELLAYIDRSEFITSKCGLETNVGRSLQTYMNLHNEIREQYRVSLPAMYMAIFLSLTHTNQLAGGLFDAYLKTLPSLNDLQHLPVFWNERSLKELQNSRVKPAIQQRRVEWAQEYEIVMDAIRETSRSSGTTTADFVDLEMWCWARSILTSRAFMDDIKSELCLVPYVDMMNHISTGQAASQEDVIRCNWNIDASGFRLILPNTTSYTNAVNDASDTSVTDSSTQIEISYGTHSNSNFLMNYGFSIVGDAHQMVEDKAILSLSLNVKESTSAAEILWEADGMGNCHDICRNVTVAIGDPGSMQSLLSLCRVASCQGLELGRMTDVFVQIGEKTTQTDDGLVPQLGATLCRSPFSICNEIRAMEKLQTVAIAGLREYDTTLAEDDDLLSNGMNWRWRWFAKKRNIQRLHNALIVRRGEKQVMQHFYNLATLALRFLQVTRVDFDSYKGMLEATLETDEPIMEVS